MKSRKIINPFKIEFTPFNSYGKPIAGMSWHKISYNQKTGVGSYILKMDPGTRSLKHKHQNYEEFYVLEGELIDEDNTTFNKGDFISYKPGSEHSSFSKKGCVLLVFLRKKNKAL
tara:strand:- start:36 stop:380 length:345 start_codon:yes stop_codon:yes gene_type:complete